MAPVGFFDRPSEHAMDKYREAPETNAAGGKWAVPLHGAGKKNAAGKGFLRRLLDRLPFRKKT